MAGAFFDDQTMFILGVTGGIATGKSSVLSFFASLGAPVTSADSIARDLMAPGTVLTREVLAVFPQCQLADQDGPPAIARHILGELIFADPESRKKLESLTHPPIVAALKGFSDSHHSVSGKAAVVEIPLLYESGLSSLVDAVLVVSCSHNTQIARLMSRQNLTRIEAETRIAAQWPLDEKRSLADYVVENEGDFEETANQLRDIWDSL